MPFPEPFKDMSKQTVLLVNLGSPDSPTVRDVRRYLREFLSDPRVLDAPWPIRQFVLNAFILPFRPKQSAHAYQSIWTSEGSPLVVMSRRVQSLLQAKTDLPVELAMRYGKPSIQEVVGGILKGDTKEILLVPLYPHYAMSSYETVVERVREVLKGNPEVKLKVLPPFYKDPDYVKALVASASAELSKPYDHLLFSFHGLPERHMKLADPSKSHCLQRVDCCVTPHAAHEFCYRAQCFSTVREFVKFASIPESRYSVAFQSRLGSDPWLKPYTDVEIAAMPARGIRRLRVICPAFVSDCLETLEEIGMRARESFLAAGGEDFALIPCLNDHPAWIETLNGYVNRLRT